MARTTATCAYPKHGPPNGIFTWLLALFILCAAGADLPVDRLAFDIHCPVVAMSVQSRKEGYFGT